jgi:hypothetical protein
MSPLLYLHYRATTSDPWIGLPLLTLSSPATPAGALPAAHTTIETGIEALPPNNCLFSSDLTPTQYDNYLALRITTPGLMKAEADILLQFLINYKNAALHEAKYPGYLTSDFVTATIGNIKLIGEHGSFQLSFRLASQISS